MENNYDKNRELFPTEKPWSSAEIASIAGLLRPANISTKRFPEIPQISRARSLTSPDTACGWTGRKPSMPASSLSIPSYTACAGGEPLNITISQTLLSNTQPDTKTSKLRRLPIHPFSLRQPTAWKRNHPSVWQ